VAKTAPSKILAVGGLLILGFLPNAAFASLVSRVASPIVGCFVTQAIPRCCLAAIWREEADLMGSVVVAAADSCRLIPQSGYGACAEVATDCVLGSDRSIFLGNALFIYPSGEGALYRNGKKPEDLLSLHSRCQAADDQPGAGVFSAGHCARETAMRTVAPRVLPSPRLLWVPHPSPALLPRRTLPFRGLATQCWAALVPEAWSKSAPLRRGRMDGWTMKREQ